MAPRSGEPVHPTTATRPVRVPATLVLLAVACAAAVAFLVGHWLDDATLRLVVKPIPVACAVVFVALHGRGIYAWLIGVGLVLSIAGDVLLEIPDGSFVAGLVAFLVAHLAYIGAALTDTTRPAVLRSIPVGIYCTAVYVALFWGMGDLAVPVAIYVAVIGVMVWRMAARVDGRRDVNLALAGAILFALSDSLIAVRKFSGDFTGIREAIILLYWLGQAGITASVVRALRTREG